MRRKKLLFIVDSYEWALANRARALKSFYSNVHIDIKHFNDLRDVNFESYNIVYSLNWPIHGYIHKKIKPNRRYRLITSISSHIGQPRDAVFHNLLKQYDAVSLSNRILYRDIHKKFPKLKIFYTPFGVDSDVFFPTTKTSTLSNVFGWVGNSSRDVKRFHEITEVIDQVPDIEFKVVDQHSGLSRAEMAEFYNQIGTLICFSKSEGTPNPILEAAACARSIISTPVGNVPELVRGNNDIQIINRPRGLKRAIIRNRDNPGALDLEGKFLKMKVDQYWNWDIRAKEFKIFLGI